MIRSIANNLRKEGQLNVEAYKLVKQEFRTYAIRIFIPVFLLFLLSFSNKNIDVDRILKPLIFYLPIYFLILLFTWRQLRTYVLIATFGKNTTGQYDDIWRRSVLNSAFDEWVMGKSFTVFCNYKINKNKRKLSTIILGKFLPHGRKYSSLIVLRDSIFSKEPIWDELTLPYKKGDNITLKYLEHKPSLFLPDIGTVMKTYNLIANKE